MPNIQKKIQKFDHHAFQIGLEELLFDFATNDKEEGRILRAWELAQAFMEVHACVDETEEQTHEQALRHAWYDLWRIFAGDKATYLYWGIYEELRHSCRPHDADLLDARVASLGQDCTRPSKKGGGRKRGAARGRKKPAPGGAKKGRTSGAPSHRPTRVPFLTIVD